MAVPTYSELLDAAKTTMLNILQNGQHIASDGRVYTSADLAEVEKTIDFLESKITNQSNGGIFGRMKTGVPYRA